MADIEGIILETAEQHHATLLANLLELYVHDLSEAFDVDIGPDGRFGYPNLHLYWAQPKRRFAFLIKAGSKVAGFVLVTIGSPMSDDPNVYDMAEFFVLRRYRRSGVGARAAIAAWDHFPGRWVVRVATGNRAAVSFWRKAIDEYTGGELTEVERQNDRQAWRVFSFETTRETNM